jgi:hypothetical protein
MFACTLALAGVAVPVGLGVAVMLTLMLVFELSFVPQDAQKTATVNKSSKVIVRRI